MSEHSTLFLLQFNMFGLAVIVAVICCAVGQDEYTCCSPDQWECTARQAGVYTSDETELSSITGLGKVAYDWTKTRVVFDEDLLVNGTETKFKLIRSFSGNTGTQYLILGDECFTEEIPRPMLKSCVPAGAEELSTYRLGVGTNSIQVTSRQWQDLEFPYYTIGISTTQGCVPVVQGLSTVLDNEGEVVTVSISIIYSDVTPGIQDDSVFTPPSSCTSSPPPRFITKYYGYKLMNQKF